MHKERDAEGFTGSGDESGYLQLGACNKNQLNVRITDGAHYQLEQLKERFGKSYGALVEDALKALWSQSIRLRRGRIRSGDHMNLDAVIGGYESSGNANYALWLFHQYFGRLWDTLAEALERLEKAGIELPLER